MILKYELVPYFSREFGNSVGLKRPALNPMVRGQVGPESHWKWRKIGLDRIMFEVAGGRVGPNHNRDPHLYALSELLLSF